MAPSSSSSHAKRIRLAIFLSVSVATAGGIAIRVMGYPAAVPQAIKWALTGFIEPGLTIWWFTIGGAFQGFPSNGSGYVVAIGGNIAFWLIMAALATGLARSVRQRIGSKE
jgi:hypothetical protein